MLHYLHSLIRESIILLVSQMKPLVLSWIGEQILVHHLILFKREKLVDKICVTLSHRIIKVGQETPIHPHHAHISTFPQHLQGW